VLSAVACRRGRGESSCRLEGREEEEEEEEEEDEEEGKQEEEEDQEDNLPGPPQEGAAALSEELVETVTAAFVAELVGAAQQPLQITRIAIGACSFRNGSAVADGKKQMGIRSFFGSKPSSGHLAAEAHASQAQKKRPAVKPAAQESLSDEGPTIVDESVLAQLPLEIQREIRQSQLRQSAPSTKKKKASPNIADFFSRPLMLSLQPE
jgi:hypothetical protein